MNYNEPLLPDNYYHIYNHAVGNDNLFRSDENYKYFLKRYGDFILPVASSYAYCLLPNHFHFLVRIRSEAELQQAYLLKYAESEKKPQFIPHDFTMQCFSNLFNAYAKAYNKRYERKGALFLDYMRRKQVSDENYFTNLVHYIHYNAVHHKLCKKVEDWDYTSYHAHLSGKATKLERDEVLRWFNGAENMRAIHRQLPKQDMWMGLEF